MAVKRAGDGEECPRCDGGWERETMVCSRGSAKRMSVLVGWVGVAGRTRTTDVSKEEDGEESDEERGRLDDGNLESHGTRARLTEGWLRKGARVQREREVRQESRQRETYSRRRRGWRRKRKMESVVMVMEEEEEE